MNDNNALVTRPAVSTSAPAPQICIKMHFYDTEALSHSTLVDAFINIGPLVGIARASNNCAFIQYRSDADAQFLLSHRFIEIGDHSYELLARWKCRSCHYTIPDTLTHCTNCTSARPRETTPNTAVRKTPIILPPAPKNTWGATSTLIESSPPLSAASARVESALQKFESCSSCAAENIMGFKFCNQCGQSRAADPLTCTQCSASNLCNWKYCNRCGSSSNPNQHSTSPLPQVLSTPVPLSRASSEMSISGSEDISEEESDEEFSSNTDSFLRSLNLEQYIPAMERMGVQYTSQLTLSVLVAANVKTFHAYRIVKRLGLEDEQ